MAVAQDLHLDVARTRHQPLDVDAVNAKSRQGLGAAAGVGGGQVGRALDHAHAASATAANGLEQDGGSALRGQEVLRLLQRNRRVAARQHGNLALLCQPAGAGLVAKQLELRHGRPDEMQAGVGTGLGKVSTLAEKAVTRVDGIASAGARSLKQGGRVQVGGGAAGRERDGRVGGAGMQYLRIVLGIDGDAADAQVLRRAHDA